MRAMIVDAPRATPAVRDIPEPITPTDGVVVQVLATGLCRSDWHAWAGHDADVDFPLVPGHELAGIVTDVGPEVSRWSVGDRVTVPFICGCGRCEWCLSGNAQVCPAQQQPGFTHQGSFAEKVALHAADVNLVRVPDTVDIAAAAALGCRFATAHRALVERARVQAGEWVAIVGAGGVGLSAVMIAVALGAHVVAVDRTPAALAVARELGAEHTVVADGRDIPDAIAAVTGGGAHVAVDAVGSEQTSGDALLSLRRRGRHVQIGLLPAVNGHPRLPMERVIAWELDLFGSHGMPAADYPAMLRLIEAGVLDPARLVERTISLEDAARSLPSFDTATVAGITIIDPQRR